VSWRFTGSDASPGWGRANVHRKKVLSPGEKQGKGRKKEKNVTLWPGTKGNKGKKFFLGKSVIA